MEKRADPPRRVAAPHRGDAAEKAGKASSASRQKAPGRNLLEAPRGCRTCVERVEAAANRTPAAKTNAHPVVEGEISPGYPSSANRIAAGLHLYHLGESHG